MLPVSEAEALNIVVVSPCWKYGWTDMLSFKYLSMAFRKSGKPGQDVYLTLFFWKNLLKRTLLLLSFFVMVNCIFVSECRVSTYC
jgi:hypothetical protein